MNDELSHTSEHRSDTCDGTNASMDIEILHSDIDRNGHEIAKMSDFLGDSLKSLASRRLDRSTELVRELPVTAAASIHNALSIGRAVIETDYSWIPDFDSLPKGVRRNLDKGIYSIGESRQVEGNHRAVILDENGVRVKDVTLKQIKNDSNYDVACRDLLTQIKLQQISSLLEEVAEMQAYQIKRDRDADITIPFFNARDLILEAEAEEDPKRRESLLREARRGFGNVSNALYAYLSRDIDLLANRSSHQLPIVDKRVTLFLNPTKINEAMGSVLEDLQALQKSVGLQVQISYALDDNDTANRLLGQYSDELLKFCERPLDGTGRSAAQIMHAYFPYSEENKDAWHKLRKNVARANETTKKLAENEAIYLIELEDVEDGTETA